MLVDLRSLSTPDFQQLSSSEVLGVEYPHISFTLSIVQVSSPYVSLEMLDDPDYQTKHHRAPHPQIYSTDSSSDSSCGIQIMTKPKLLKRPKRPGKGRLMKSSSVDKVSIKYTLHLVNCYCSTSGISL